MKALPDAIDRWMPRRLTSLGTDGFGRSEGRASLRDFFEVDAKSHRRWRRSSSWRATARSTRRSCRRRSRIWASTPRSRIRRLPERCGGSEADSHERSRLSEFKVPELGENVAGGDVTRVLVNVGDTIARDQPVLELETDKATIEVPSSVAGVVKEIKVKKGDKVKVGAVVLTVDDGAVRQRRRRRRSAGGAPNRPQRRSRRPLRRRPKAQRPQPEQPEAAADEGGADAARVERRRARPPQPAAAPRPPLPASG